MRPLTILFTHYTDDRITRVHHALLRRHNPGVPVVPLYSRIGVAAGFTPFLPGSIDVGEIVDPMFNVDRFPTFWWSYHRTTETEAHRYVVVESDVLVTAPLWRAFDPAWGADVAGVTVATPDSHPNWEWWRGVSAVTPWARAGVMPAGVAMYSNVGMEVLSRSRLRCMAEARIGTAARLAGIRLDGVPGLAPTVHCNPAMIHLSSEPGVYHPVKVFGGPGGECLAAHEFGESLVRANA